MTGSPRLIEQIAADAGVSVRQARLAACVQQLAATQPLDRVAHNVGRSRTTVQRIARRWLIDFPDYRPFARRKQRPAPIGRLGGADA